MTKDDEDFENPTKCWNCNNVYVEAKRSFPYHEKIQRLCTERLLYQTKLNHKIPIVFYNLKASASHLIMYEQGKFDFKINIIPNGLEKYMNFNILRASNFNCIKIKKLNTIVQ